MVSYKYKGAIVIPFPTVHPARNRPIMKVGVVGIALITEPNHMSRSLYRRNFCLPIALATRTDTCDPTSAPKGIRAVATANKVVLREPQPRVDYTAYTLELRADS